MCVLAGGRGESRCCVSIIGPKKKKPVGQELMNRKWQGCSVPRGDRGWGAEGLKKRPQGSFEGSASEHCAVPRVRAEGVDGGCVQGKSRKIILNITIVFPPHRVVTSQQVSEESEL